MKSVQEKPSRKLDMSFFKKYSQTKISNFDDKSTINIYLTEYNKEKHMLLHIFHLWTNVVKIQKSMKNRYSNN
jgi:hypothetical protein